MSRRAMLLEALAATPRDLERVARRVGPEAALAQLGPEGRSIAAIVAHMLAAEPHYAAIFRRAVTEERPVVHDVAPPWPPHGELPPLAELAARFAAARAETIAFLGGLAQAEWARWLVYGAAGPIRLREQVQALVGHDNEHLEQIATLRELL